eukprot:gene15168-biopygen8358
MWITTEGRRVRGLRGAPGGGAALQSGSAALQGGGAALQGGSTARNAGCAWYSLLECHAVHCDSTECCGVRGAY